MTLRLSADVLFELERELNEPKFMGVPIGSTLGNIFSLHLHSGLREWGYDVVLKDCLRVGYHHWGSARPQDSASKSDFTGRILVTLLSNHYRIADLMIPVIQSLGAADCVTLVKDRSTSSVLPGDHEYITLDSFVYNRYRWLREFYRCFPHWLHKLKPFLRRHAIPIRIIPHLYDEMLQSTKRVALYKSLLHSLAPSAILTEYDRSSQFSGLILAATSQGIPTFTMQHGVINPPYGYTPLLADIMFCWGQLSFDQLVGMGVEPERLVLGGCPRLTNHTNKECSDIRDRLSIEDDQQVVLYASSPILFEHRRQQLISFCSAFEHSDRIAAVVRLHPSERNTDYSDIMLQFPFVRFTGNDFMSQDDALAIADIVVNRDSGFGNDALIKGKPVVIFDVIDVPLSNGQSLVEIAGCPYVTDSHTLCDIAERIISSDSYRQKLLLRAKGFVEYQFSAFAEEAADNVAQVIRKRQLTRVDERIG